MTKQIKTYNDLVEEKQRLEVLLKAQKELIRLDIEQLKTSVQPAIQTFSWLGKLLTKDKTNGLINSGIDTAIDLLVKKLILGRAGWLTRLTVPFLLKNLTSHVVAENKQGLVKKIFSWFRPKSNGQVRPDPITKESEAGNGPD